jgi:hypothetical protein
LVLAVLRALQSHPQLLHHWRGSCWFQLLGARCAVLRWAAVQGVGLMLCCAEAVTSRLMAAHLSTAQRVEAEARWVVGAEGVRVGEGIGWGGEGRYGVLCSERCGGGGWGWGAVAAIPP